MTDIRKKVIELIAEQFGVDESEVTGATRFIEDLAADSMDMIELVMECESELDLELDENAVDKFKTVGEAVEYVTSELARQGKGPGVSELSDELRNAQARADALYDQELAEMRDWFRKTRGEVPEFLQAVTHYLYKTSVEESGCIVDELLLKTIKRLARLAWHDLMGWYVQEEARRDG